MSASRHKSPVLIVGVIAAFFLSNKANYVYDVNTLESSSMSENKFSVSMVNKEFGMVNQLAVIVPNGDYEKEAQTLKALEKLDVVKSVQGLGNIEAMDGYMLHQMSYVDWVKCASHNAYSAHTSSLCMDSDCNITINGAVQSSACPCPAYTVRFFCR